MRKIYVLIAMICLCVGVAGASVIPQLDYVNIGDATSEAGHSLTSWSGLWAWGGTYGGGDDGTLRTIIPNGPNCESDDEKAYFSMNANGGIASTLELRHLQGSQDDNYMLYYQSNTGDWVQLNKDSSYDSYCVGNECWYTDSYTLPSLTGNINFKVVAFVNPIPSWCETWGLNAFSWARIRGSPITPEFTTITALISLAGAAVVLMVLRKKN